MNSSPPCRNGAHGSSCARNAIALWLIALAASGCASMGRRGPVPDEVAKCRELTQQGVAAIELGQWQQAELLLNRATKASPVDSVTRQHLAEVLWHRGATEDALVQMEAAVRLDSGDSTLVVRSGEMLLATGAVDEALERAEEAIRLSPTLSSAWVLRGRAHWRMNEVDRALADLHRALQYAPDSSDVLMDVAALYRQRGQHDRCLTTLHHLLDSYPSGQEPQTALWMEGMALAELGRPQQASDSLQAASRQGPPNADILYYLAQAQLASGSPSDAAATAHEAVATDASHQPSRRLLIELASHAAEDGTHVR